MFDDFLKILDNAEFEEEPVDIDTFLKGEDYMNRPDFSLSPIQRQCVLNSTQIFKKETLYTLMSADEAERRWSETKNEIILQLGKGSGKDFMSEVSCCYTIYQLLCLKDPAQYYGKPAGNSIDILNIAVNAKQAENVFFKGVSDLIQRSPWFKGKYEAKPGGEPSKQSQFNFIKNVNLYSGHSEREAWEGYNLFMVILDEISGFALESASPTGKTAEAIYRMYRRSVVSRFPDFGKYISLSFPRFKGDFIQQRYDDVVLQKTVIPRVERVKINPDLPDAYPDNYINIEWDEDHIDLYKAPKVFALKRPPWDVNPTRTLRDYVGEFVDNYTDAAGGFACMPPEAVDAFFKDRTKVEEAFSHPNGVDNTDGTFSDDFKPIPDKEYFVHVDLAQKHDRCAVAMVHVDKWVRRELAGKVSDPAPVIKVDALRYWQPTKQKEVDFTEVQDYIVSLRTKGFNIKVVTFDQWRSEDMRKYLNSIGIRSDLLSVKTEQYVDMAVIMNESRLEGPREQLIIDELLQLRLYPNGKIDHTRKGYKDLSDATCGAVYNAIKRTSRAFDQEIEVKTYSSYKKPVVNKLEDDNIIRAPKSGRIPPEIAAYLSRQGPKVI